MAACCGVEEETQVRGPVGGMQELSNGELAACDRGTQRGPNWHEEKLSTALKAPTADARAYAPLDTVPLSSGRCPELPQAGLRTQPTAPWCPLPMGSTGALGQPYSNRPRAELPLAQAWQSLGQFSL